MQLAGHYTERFDALASGWQDGYLRQRRQALRGLLERGFPGRRQEAWKFTDVEPIAKCPFEPAAPGRHGTERPDTAPGAVPACTLQLIDGVPLPTSPGTAVLPPGVILRGYGDSPESLPPEVRAGFEAETDDGFLLMNTAFLTGGACLYVPPGCRLTRPVYLDCAFTRPAAARAYNLRNVLVLGEGAAAEVIERYRYPNRDDGDRGSPDLCNAITRVVLAPGARMEHSQAAACGRAAYPLLSVQVAQRAGSRYRGHALGRHGGLLGRQEFRVTLSGEGAGAELDCLHLLDGDSHLEYRTLVVHAVPDTRSLQLFRGLLEDRAHGVFNGQVCIRPGASGTVASQDGASLLLSDDARTDASPMLEIHNDAVQCNHGVTVGRLDEDALFYLRTRGLERPRAERMLRGAFARAVLERLPEATQAVLTAIDPAWARGLPLHEEAW